MTKTKNKNIFFLGAGFSKEFFDLPLNNELFSMLMNGMKKYLSFDSNDNNEDKYEYDEYFKKRHQRFDDSESIKEQYRKVLYFILFISIFLLFQNTFENNEDNEEVKELIKQINTKWMTYKINDVSPLNIKKFLYYNMNNLVEENIEMLLSIENEINDFIKSNNEVIKEIINTLKKKLSSISQIFSKIEFVEQEIPNFRDVETYIEKSEICQISKICIYYYIRDILDIPKNINNKTKETLDNFIENIKDSLIIDFNWDNKFCEYLNKDDKEKLKICKIHKSIDNFNIITSTPLRSSKEKEIYELDKHINDFLDKNRNEILNIYFIGISLTYYDEIFLHKLHEHSFNKEQQVNYIYFCYDDDFNHERECQKNNKEFKFLNFNVKCYKKFEEINSIIEKNNK